MQNYNEENNNFMFTSKARDILSFDGDETVAKKHLQQKKEAHKD